MPKIPKRRRNNPLQVIWKNVYHEGQLVWEGHLYSRRKVVCSAMLSTDFDNVSRLWLESIETEIPYRRQGYAKRLLQSLRDMFCEDFTEISLIVKPFGEKQHQMSAPSLINFYEKFGFISQSNTRGYHRVWSLKFD